MSVVEKVPDCKAEIIPEEFYPSGFGIAMPLDSPYKPFFDETYVHRTMPLYNRATPTEYLRQIKPFRYINDRNANILGSIYVSLTFTNTKNSVSTRKL